MTEGDDLYDDGDDDNETMMTTMTMKTTATVAMMPTTVGRWHVSGLTERMEGDKRGHGGIAASGQSTARTHCTVFQGTVVFHIVLYFVALYSTATYKLYCISLHCVSF